MAEGRLSKADAAAAGSALGADRSWDGWTQRLSAAAERWKRRGFAHTLDVELAALGTWPRLLARANGEREATDLRHLIELLHAEERARRLSPASLAGWLTSPRDADANTLGQRLESDANAVRVETVHVSKGLEYPIVLLPFTWHVKKKDNRSYEPVTLRSASEPSAPAPDGDPPAPPKRASQHRLDLRSPYDDARKSALADLEKESRQEELRKLYVALTRARHHTVAWWGLIGDVHTSTDKSAFGRLLTRDASAQGFAGSEIKFDASSGEGPTPFERVSARLDDLCTAAHSQIAWSPAVMPAHPLQRWAGPKADTLLTEWPADRVLPTFSGRCGVSSYSSLARGAAAADLDEKKRAEAAPAIEEAANDEDLDIATRPTPDDKSDPEGGAAAGVSAPASVPPYENPLLLEAGGGTRFGTFVHEVFERVDFPTVAPHDDDACHSLDALLDALGAQHGYARESRERAQLAKALQPILETPLGSNIPRQDGLPALPSDFTLAQLARADRLDELPFDLALGAGTQYERQREPQSGLNALAARPDCVDPSAVYEALSKIDDPVLKSRLGPWLDFQEQRKGAEKALIGSIAGILTGSIDLAFRVRTSADSTMYFVADYKTNRIKDCQPGHFTGPWLDWKMQTSGYLLQSLLYSLALHRHLTLRVNGYDYDKHFGGALYLFVRGMIGANTPRCTETGHALGVHALRWPKAVIQKLDAALSPPRKPAVKEKS